MLQLLLYGYAVQRTTDNIDRQLTLRSVTGECFDIWDLDSWVKHLNLRVTLVTSDWGYFAHSQQRVQHCLGLYQYICLYLALTIVGF